MKNIEIEVRGPLSKIEFENLVNLLEKNGRKITTKERILIDYSTFLGDSIEDRKKDIRVRVTNGVAEIVVKMGAWGGTDKRKELSVLIGSGSFDTLVEIFAALGYQKGVLCVRKTEVYEYKGIEFALVEVLNHSFYYEAEKMATSEENADEITTEIKSVCRELELEIFDKKGFFEYIEKLNKEANEIFEYNSSAQNYFKNRFGV